MQDLEQSFYQDYQYEEEELDRRIADLEGKIAGYEGVASESSEQKRYSLGQHLAEIPKAIGGGFTHAIENTAEALDEVWDFAGKHWEDLHERMPDIPFSKGHMSHPSAPETATGKIVQSATQFLVGFIPATKVVKAAGITAKFGQTLSAMAAGGAADYAVFDPEEGRIMDAIQSLDPDLKIPVLSYLTSDEDDSAIESRLKNVAEGALTGALGEAFFSAIKGIKGSIGKKIDVMPEEATQGPRLDSAVDDMQQKMATNQRLDEAISPEKHLVNDLSDEQVGRLKDVVLNGKDPGEIDFGLLNIDHIDTIDDVKEVITKVGSTTEEMFDKAGKTKRQTWEENKSYFADYNVSKETFSQTVKNADMLAHEVTGLRMVHADVANQVHTMAKQITRTGGSPEELVKFERGLRVMADIQAAVKGVSAGLGRGLNALKINVGPGMIDHNVLETMVHGVGGEKAIRKKAEALLKLPTNKQKGAFLEKSIGAKSLDAVQYWWINSLLSSPTTWIVNAVSNAAVAGNSIMESAYAAGKNALGGKGDITGGVVKDQMVGMWTGLMESLRVSKEGMGTAYTAFRHDVSSIDPTQASKFDSDIGESLKFAGTPMGRALGFIKTAIGTPGRVLMATDELFKTVNYRGHLAMMASIEGRKKGFEGAALKNFVRDYMTNPTVQVHKEGLEFAKKNTFQNDLGTAGKSVQRVVNQIPALRFIMPFIRTPTNIIKYAGHHTPFINKLSSQMKEDLAAGGARAELAKAKVATGSMMFAVAGFLASQGLIAGGAHEDYRNGRNNLIGRQSYSVKLGDKWHSFSRLDPFGLFFGLTADMAELIQHSPEEEWGEIAGGLILAFSQNLASKTYLKGLIDFTDGIMNSHGDATKTEKWLTSFTSSFIPNFMNQTNRIHFDKQMKEVNEFVDNFKRRVYGASGGVMAKRNQLTGEIINYKDALWGGYLQVFKQEDGAPGSVEQVIYDSHAKVREIPKQVSMPVGRTSATTPLTGEEYDRLQTLVLQEAKVGGKNMYAYLADLFNSDAFKALPSGDEDDSGSKTKRGMIRKVSLIFNNIGNKMLYDENPGIQQRISEQVEAKRQALIMKMKGQQ